VTCGTGTAFKEALSFQNKLTEVSMIKILHIAYSLAAASILCYSGALAEEKPKESIEFNYGKIVPIQLSATSVPGKLAASDSTNHSAS